MTTYYRIVDWDRHYEVDDRGHAWKDGKAFRHGPLEYVRVKARGRDFSRSALALSDMAGESMYFALGVFQKIAEIVARAPRYLREGGVIRNRKGEPATVEEIAWMLRVKIDTLREFLRLLVHPEVAWLEEVTEACLRVPGIPGIPGIPGTSGSPGKFRDPSAISEHESGAFVGSTDKSRTRTSKDNKRIQDQELTEATETDLVRECWADACKEIPLEPDLPTPPLYDIYSLSGFDGTRLAFLRELRSTLGCDSNASNAAIINFERWVHEEFAGAHAAHEERMAKLGIVIGIARDCRKAIKPAAAFMQRVKDELGYIPPTTGKLRERGP